MRPEEKNKTWILQTGEKRTYFDGRNGVLHSDPCCLSSYTLHDLKTK